jgi:Zn finger protein HypA/HybF involved in hydrogenase expression
MSGWSTGYGTKTVTFRYTENSVTVTKSVEITVLPNLTGLSVSPASQSIKRYSNPYFAVTATYEDGTSKTISGGYTITGLNINNIGTQTVGIKYTENSITKSATSVVTITKLTTTCPICGYTYELDENDIDQGCPECSAKAVKIVVSPDTISIEQGKTLPITVTAVYRNGKTGIITGWISDYNPNIVGIQLVKVEYQGVYTYITVEVLAAQKTCPICGNSYRLSIDGSDPGCPYCSKEVISIDIAENNIFIEKYQTLPLTVTAAYRDGHTAIVDGWTVNFIADTIGTYEVIIFYKSVTDHVIVTVIDEGYTICPYCGLEYYRKDSPSGCPVCSKTIVGIEAYLRNGGTQVLYKSQLNLKIVLLYKDTHRMVTYSGYTVSGYHSDVIGIHNVTVYYGSFITSLSVEVIAGPAKVICPNGHDYYLNEDGSDPGCPYCESGDKDKGVLYFSSTYTDEIVEALYTDGFYKLAEGDYLTVIIAPGNKSIRSKLKNMFFKTNAGVKNQKYTFGGEVK